MQRDDEFWHKMDAQYRQRLIHFVNARLAVILRRSEDPGYAEDVVNETFRAAYQNYQSFNAERGEFESWLFGIARNQTFDFLRKHGELKSEQLFEEFPPEVEARASGPEFLYPADARSNPKTAALRRAMKQLSPYEQELLICRLGNQLSYEEIERYFNHAVKRDTLRVHVNRAEARLRKVLMKMPEFADMA